MRIIFPNSGYIKALEEAGIPTLAGRRDLLSKNLFNDIVITKDDKLVNLHQQSRTTQQESVQFFSMNRFKNYFIIDNSLNYIA